MRTFILTLLFPLVAVGETIELLPVGEAHGWEYQTFRKIKETTYRTEVDAALNRPVLVADSEGGASGWTLRRDVDLTQTPWLHFLWRVDAVGENPAEQSCDGDDFAWRLYFLTKGIVRYRVLNFVYAQSAAIDERWDSPYATLLNKIKLQALAVHDDSQLGQWQHSSVNLRDAWRSAFNETPTIHLVGLMTDGDSAGVTMRVRYGAIVLSDSPAPPFAPE